MKAVENQHFVAFLKKVIYKIVIFCSIFLTDCKQIYKVFIYNNLTIYK